MEITYTFSYCTLVNKGTLRIPLRFLSRRYYCIKPPTTITLPGSSSALEVFLSCNMHHFPSFYNTAEQFELSDMWHPWMRVVPGWKEAPTYSFQSSVSGNINLGWAMLPRIKRSDLLSATRWLRKQPQTRECNHSWILERVCKVSG